MMLQEDLWQVADDSPEGEYLEILVTLVQAYEATHHPIPHPIRLRPFCMKWKAEA